MNLKFLKGDKCPVCGCDIIVEEKVEIDNYSKKIEYREHTSGGRWEYRLFGCGQRLEYCPNFSKTLSNDYYKCKNNNEYKEKERKREVFKKELNEFIDRYIDVDEDYKNSAKDKFMYI